MISPHIKWLKHGINAETALVGSVVVGRIAFDGDLWAWQASLPHGDLMADHGGCETERQAKEHVEAFLKLWLADGGDQPSRSYIGRRARVLTIASPKRNETRLSSGSLHGASPCAKAS